MSPRLGIARRLLYAASLLALFALVQPAKAGPITFTFTGTLSGSLGSTPLDDVSFTWTVIGDTSTVGQPNHPLQYEDIGTSSTIFISGVGTETFTTSITAVADLRSSHDNIDFGDSAQADLAVGIEDASIAGWSSPLTSNFALGDPGILVDFCASAPCSLPTSGGSLTITSVGDLTFQAALSTPEPSPAIYTFAGAACLLLYRRLRAFNR